MYLDIETRSEEFAAAVLSVDDNARGPIATAFVCGANEMLEAIEKNHYIVEATRVTETNMDDMSHDDEVMFDKDISGESGLGINYFCVLDYQIEFVHFTISP